MRDGVKLHTVIIVPTGARNAPILLTRTPYDASRRTAGDVLHRTFKAQETMKPNV